jgi:hypothetical protein
MQRFIPEMRCCRVDRENAGFSCSREDQLSCGVTALAGRFEAAPDQSGRLLADLIAVFPDRLAGFLAEAELAAVPGRFIHVASRSCAALSTKTERHAFRGQFAVQLNPAALASFDEQMAAEWHRLRRK